MKRLFILSILVFVLAACGTLTDEGLVFRTADPNLSVGWRLLPPPQPHPDNPVSLPTVTPSSEPEVLPTITPTPCRTIARTCDGQYSQPWLALY